MKVFDNLAGSSAAIERADAQVVDPGSQQLAALAGAPVDVACTRISTAIPSSAARADSTSKNGQSH
jgi:hypothetical protein